MKRNKLFILLPLLLLIAQTSFAIQPFDDVEIGMSKKKVMVVIGIEPKEKKKVSFKSGIYECWIWELNRNPFQSGVLFLNGAVVSTGFYSCPFELFDR